MHLDHSTRLGKPTPDRVGSGQGSQTYQYNAIGNIMGRISGTPTTSYWYSYTAHKHVVTRLSDGETYQYDLNRNTLHLPVQGKCDAAGRAEQHMLCEKRTSRGNMPGLALIV